MTTGVDIMAELAKKTFLENRTPQTTEAEESETFARLTDFEDGAIFVGKFRGESCWERHLQGDELLQVMEGEVEVTVLGDSVETLRLTAGMIAVLHKGKWHRLNAANSVTLMTVTPLPTECSTTYPREA
jgi:quercetin dioxygenase-like cupin family protein